MFRTAVGFTDETRQTLVGMLNQTLADATDLMTQVKFAHWNVKGMNFYQLHLLFDEIAETLEHHVDTVAERATALGGEATGTVRMAAANSRIPEIPSDVTTDEEYVTALVERVGIHANNLRAEIETVMNLGDEDTADMYIELSREVDKQLYFLEAHVQGVTPQSIPSQPGASVQQGTPAKGQTVQTGTARTGETTTKTQTAQTGTAPQYQPSGQTQGRTEGKTRRRYGGKRR